MRALFDCNLNWLFHRPQIHLLEMINLLLLDLAYFTIHVTPLRSVGYPLSSRVYSTKGPLCLLSPCKILFNNAMSGLALMVLSHLIL